MKLNYDSWFAKTYLQLNNTSSHHLPRTICELGRLFLLTTVMWFSALSAFSIVAFMYLTTLYGFGLVLFTKQTFHDIFLNPKVYAWMNTSFTITCVITSAIVAIASVIGIKKLIAWRKEVKFMRNYKETGSYYKQSTPNPVIEMTKGLWKRFHDKTCTIIDWENTKASYWEQYDAYNDESEN